MKRFATMAALMLLAGPDLAGPVLAGPVQEANKAVARRVFTEIFNRGNFAMAQSIYAPDFVNHGLHQDIGLAEDQAAARG